MKTIMSVTEAAEYLSLSESLLNKMRCQGIGPEFVRLGKRRVGYLKTALDDFIRSGTHRSTAEYIAR